jgi:hypothetical protein
MLVTRQAFLAVLCVASWSVFCPWPAAAQWNDSDKLMGSSIGGLDEFGYAVGISGTATIVGSRNDDDLGTDAGAAYIFRQSGSSWNEEDKFLASDGAAGDRFGQSVAISGTVAVVGAYLDDVSTFTDCGSAYVFRFNGSQWNQEAKLTASDKAAADYFGWAVSIDGNVIIVGAYGEDDGGTSAGAAYIFNHNGSTWVQEARLKAGDADAGDYFGVSVGISGTRAVIGAYLDEAAAASAGSAYIFKDLGTTWTQEVKLLPAGLESDDRFGHAVAISGDVAVVGAVHDDDLGANSGAAYVFERNNTVWPLSAKIKAGDGAAGDKFGTAVSASMDVIVVGALWDDAGSFTDSGAAYVFRDTGSWTQEDKVVASDPYYWEFFGNAVAVSNGKAVVGAYNDNSGGMDAGAGYVFISGGTTGCSTNSQCNDSNACTTDTCQSGSCVNAPLNCNDNNGCTVDACSNGTCTHTPLNCNDNNACTTDSCSNGTCSHTPITCNDNNACTTNSCNAATGCVYTPIVCNDSNACTTNSCNSSTGCVYTPINCNDSDACTIDSCSGGWCYHDPNPNCEQSCSTNSQCNDGNACTTDLCQSGNCVHTTVTCNDNNACTTNSCNAATGCVYTPIVCNDNNACTTNSCNASTGCVYTPMNCNDGNACTTDFCTNGVCGHTTLNCNDNNACTVDGCSSGTCTHAPLNCSDNNACTADSCSGGTCSHTVITGCVCNQNGTCSGSETSCNCPSDCGSPVAAEFDCNDNKDEDCDGGADCNDPQGDCDEDASCCLPNNASCTNNGQCCSNKCVGSSGNKICK